MPQTQQAAPLSPATTAPARLLYPDLPQELALTRRMLERVPDGNFEWRPHGKSMTLGRLAMHLAELPGLARTILSADELDFATSGYRPRTASSTAELLAKFDELSAAMQATLDAADWTALGRRWRMRSGDAVILDDVKATLIRTVGISHMAHHRAQLGVYLRLLDVAVPGIYGPSADEM